MGRPRKPTALHVVQGTARKSRMKARSGEPKPTGPLGSPPKWFTPYQRAEWGRLRKFSWITEAHRLTVQHHCILAERLKDDAIGQRQPDGRMLPRPMSASERQTFHSLQMQLGLTPASSSKVSVPAAAEKTDDPWQKLDKLG